MLLLNIVRYVKHLRDMSTFGGKFNVLILIFDFRQTIILDYILDILKIPIYKLEKIEVGKIFKC